jgi:L-ascorbate metabolism protein UlaG (beta-lactamase superfamily)
MLGRVFSFVIVGLLALAGTAHAQGKAELQWFSQAGFKLTTPGGKVIMIDPWRTRPSCPRSSRTSASSARST